MITSRLFFLYCQAFDLESQLLYNRKKNLEVIITLRN